MFGTYLSLAVLILLFGLFALVTYRAAQARRFIAKIIGVALAGLVTVLLGLLAGTAIRGLALSTTQRNFPVADIQVEGAPGQIERGKQLAIYLCAACHSADGELPMAGGRNLADDIGLPLGDIYPPNLTPAGKLSEWTDGEILRAIREGTHKDGRPLAMPVQNLKNLGDNDTLALVAYLRSQPPVENEVPPLRPTLLANILIGAGLFDISAQPITQRVVAPPRASTLAYGKYLVDISDCRDCHGPDLSGGKPPNPPGPSLRAVAGWSKEQFFAAMRTGVDPGGNPIDPPMPWKNIAILDDVQLEALYKYLHALPATAR
jgi:mono/diheme cytochrome c family protein